MIELPSPFALLQFQVEHYTELLANAKTIKQRMHVRRELYNFKQLLKKY